MHDSNLEAEANGELAVNINNVKASWTSDKSALSLDGVNVQIPKGKLCAFIGSVGSGKVRSIIFIYLFFIRLLQMCRFLSIPDLC